MFTWESLKEKPDKFRFYTGLPSQGVFSLLLEHLDGPAKCLHVRPTPKGKSAEAASNVVLPKEKIGRPRCLSLANELLLVLVWLRHALKQEILADMFGLSGTSQVSYIINAWLPFCVEHLGGLLKWPSSEEVDRCLPESFRKDGICKKVCFILDCFEAEVEKPPSLTINAMTYSDYKCQNTFKVLVGVTPTGFVSFVSDAFPGAISDPEIARQSGLLDKLKPKGAIMADKGFTLAEAGLLQPRGLKLVLPPFREGDRQMAAEDVQRNRKVAAHRIVVENAIGRLRAWPILQHRLHIRAAQSGHVSDIIKLVAILANFNPPLRK